MRERNQIEFNGQIDVFYNIEQKKEKGFHLRREKIRWLFSEISSDYHEFLICWSKYN